MRLFKNISDLSHSVVMLDINHLGCKAYLTRLERGARDD